MIYVLPPKWPITQTTIVRRQDPQKNKGSISLHVVAHLCQFIGQNSEIWGSKKFDNFLRSQKSFKKIGTFRPSKCPIGDLFENPNQGM